MNLTFDSSAAFEVISVLAIIVVFVWRMPSRRDIERIEDRLDKVDERFDKVDERFDKVDERFDRVDERFDRVYERFDKTDDKIENTRKEAKADLARLEDRIAAGNSYQAKSVELLDAIRRELEERREPL